MMPCKTACLYCITHVVGPTCGTCVCEQSIRSYFTGDDDFNWNYGLALAATGKYREAEEALAAVQREGYRFVFVGVVVSKRRGTAWQRGARASTHPSLYEDPAGLYVHMRQCLQQCVAGLPCRFDPVYLGWRARCLVLSGRPQAAWELHSAAQAAGQAAAVAEAGYALLQQIADDCYRMGAFYYAVKVGVAACVVLCSCC